MAAGERAEEPLAELSHYVVARPIYSEAGFQEENERRPPLPPTLRERAQAACRWVAAPGGRPVRRRERGAAGPPGSGEESRAPPGDAPCRRRRTPARRGSKGPEQRGSLGGSLFASLPVKARGGEAAARRLLPAGGSPADPVRAPSLAGRHGRGSPCLETCVAPALWRLGVAGGFPVAAPRGALIACGFLAGVREKGPFRLPGPFCPSWSGCRTTG